MTYVSILFSPQQRQAWRKRFHALSRAQLEELAKEISISARSRAPNREIEIAQTHCAPELVHRVDRISDPSRRLQTIFCSTGRCPDCPHGPYWYVYRTSKRKGVVSVRYAGEGLPSSLIDQMQKEISVPAMYGVRIAKTPN